MPPLTADLPRFTPGPWEVRSNPYGHGLKFVVGQPATGQRHTLARIFAVADHPGEQEVNARLLAAAPDLYEALAALADVSRAYLAHMDAKDIAVLESARAALAKARGDA